MRLAAFLVAGLTCTWAAADELPCANGVVTVEATDAANARRACRAADQALALYSQCGVSMSGPVRIHVDGEVPEGCLGVFHCGTTDIDVLAPEAILHARKPDGLYAQVPPDVMFESVIVHEMTHALYDSVPCPYGSCMATSEYLAYAMQFEALPEVDRAQIVRGVDPDISIPRDALSATMFLFDPESFAVNAWVHYSQRPDQCQWMTWILQGRILFDLHSP